MLTNIEALFFLFWSLFCCFFFCCGPFLKSLLNLLQYCFCFMFWFFYWEACVGSSLPNQGLNVHPPVLEGKVLTTGLSEKSQENRHLEWPGHTPSYPQSPVQHIVGTCFGSLDYQNQGPQTSGQNWGCKMVQPLWKQHSSSWKIKHRVPCMCVLSHFSCVRLCDPMDCSPPGSSEHGILQAGILEWVAMPSS